MRSVDWNTLLSIARRRPSLLCRCLRVIHGLPEGTEFSPSELADRAGCTSRSILYRALDLAQQYGVVVRTRYGFYLRVRVPQLVSAEDLVSEPEPLTYPLPWGLDAAQLGPGSLLLVVGTPGTGKSVLCLNFARYLAERGFEVLMFVTEDLATLRRRFLRSLNGCAPKIRVANLTEDIVSHYRIPYLHRSQVAVLDWLDLGDEYKSISRVLAHLQERCEAGLLICAVQGHLGFQQKDEGHRTPFPTRPIAPYGRDLTMQRASLAVCLYWDEEDWERRYPYLYLLKVRHQDRLKPGQRIRLEYHPEDLTLTKCEQVIPKRRWR